MVVRLDLKNMKGTVDAIASKSDAHRTLIAAALSDKKTKLILNSTSDDIRATSDCLKSAGAVIDEDGTNLIVTPVSKTEQATFNCHESGSTIRFMIPVAAALGIDSVFTGSGRLPERPQTPLLKALSEHGVNVSDDGEFPIRISGQLESGVFTLPGNVSSQFVTGLLFALPLLDGDSEIRLIPPVESKPYINMTISTLKKFGIEVTENGDSYFIKGNQKYISPEEIVIDGDWSNGAFFAAFGAVSDITVNGLFADSIQGDKAIADIVKMMGADVTMNDSSLIVSKFVSSAKLGSLLQPIKTVVPTVIIATHAITNLMLLFFILNFIFKFFNFFLFEQYKFGFCVSGNNIELFQILCVCLCGRQSKGACAYKIRE